MRLQRLLDTDLPPDVFAIVMATGIVSVAAGDHRYHLISDVLGLLAGALFVVLAAGLALRIVARPRSAVGEINDPDVALRLFTSVAACGVLGVRFVGDSWALWVLAIAGLLAWLFLAPLAIRDVRSRPRADLRDHAHGAWLLPCVATAGLATSAADVAINARSHALLWVAVITWILGLFIYCAVAWLIGYRAAVEPFVPESVTPDSWILMGALAISALAGDHLLASANYLGDSGFIAWARPLTMVIWSIGGAWIPLLLYAEVWRVDQRAGSLHYAGVWWSAVFPLGMFSAATAATAREFDLRPLSTISLVFFWVSLTVWLLVTAGLIHLSATAWAGRSDDEFSRSSSSNLGNRTRPQEVLMAGSTTRISKVVNVVIPVDDVDKAIDFYTGPLGLEKRTDVPFGEKYRWVEVAPAGADTVIAIAPPPPGGEAGGRQTGISLETDDVDAFHAQLKAAGVDVDAEVSRMGDPIPPMFWLRDPEGNVLLVVEVMA